MTSSDLDYALSLRPVGLMIGGLIYLLALFTIYVVKKVQWLLSSSSSSASPQPSPMAPAKNKTEKLKIHHCRKSNNTGAYDVQRAGFWALIMTLAFLEPSVIISDKRRFVRHDPYNKTNDAGDNGLLYGDDDDDVDETFDHHQIIVGEGLSELVIGQDPKLLELVDEMPDLLRGPSPPLLFRNRHLQLIPWMIQNELHRTGIPYQRVNVEVTSCLIKEPGCEPDPVMTDTITLDIFPPLQLNDNENNNEKTEQELYPNFNASSPIILIAPGLRCNGQDIPGNMLIRRAYGAGFRSIVVNRRGHTPDLLLQAPRWNLFGDIDDMEQVYWHIRQKLLLNNKNNRNNSNNRNNKDTDPHTPMFLHGVSAGVGVTATGMGIWDQRRKEHPKKPTPSFVACILMEPGAYDLSRNYHTDRFRDPYNTQILTPAVKDWFVLRNQDILRAYYPDAVDAVLTAETLQDLVNAAAPMAGYRNASDFFRAANPINTMFETRTPYLIVHAVDDALINMDFLSDISPLEHHGGRNYAELSKCSERGLLAVAKTGSHGPFLDNANAGDSFALFPGLVQDPLFGGYMLDSWADRISIQYYQAALKVYNDRRFL